MHNNTNKQQLRAKITKSLEAELIELGVVNEAHELGIITTTPLEIALNNVITSHPLMLELKNKAAKLSKHTDINVLILGDTGTGKELFARIIHGNSPGQFVGVNTAGIPDTLLETEIFGCVTGAYTGATNRKGLLEEAENGTLFLDEIGDMPLLLQAKLLRAIQEKKGRRVGANVEYNITCRFVAATNRKDSDLKGSATSFRRDLYYRLAGSIIELPTLHERGNDYLMIVLSMFEKDYCPSSLLERLEIMIKTGNKLDGNIRELINIVKEFKALSIEN